MLRVKHVTIFFNFANKYTLGLVTFCLTKDMWLYEEFTVYSHILKLLFRLQNDGNVKALTLSSNQLARLRDILPEIGTTLKTRVEKSYQLPCNVRVDCNNHSKLGDFVAQIRQYCKYFVKSFYPVQNDVNSKFYFAYVNYETGRILHTTTFIWLYYTFSKTVIHSLFFRGSLQWQRWVHISRGKLLAVKAQEDILWRVDPHYNSMFRSFWCQFWKLQEVHPQSGQTQRDDKG